MTMMRMVSHHQLPPQVPARVLRRQVPWGSQPQPKLPVHQWQMTPARLWRGAVVLKTPHHPPVQVQTQPAGALCRREVHRMGTQQAVRRGRSRSLCCRARSRSLVLRNCKPALMVGPAMSAVARAAAMMMKKNLHQQCPRGPLCHQQLRAWPQQLQQQPQERQQQHCARVKASRPRRGRPVRPGTTGRRGGPPPRRPSCGRG